MPTCRKPLVLPLLAALMLSAAPGHAQQVQDDARIRLAMLQPPRSGLTPLSDDAFKLSRWSMAETLIRLDPDGLHRLAVRLTEATTGLCAALTPTEKGTGYCLARRDGDVRALTKALNTALNGRGGGKPGICQGSCAATPEQVEEFLKKNL